MSIQEMTRSQVQEEDRMAERLAAARADILASGDWRDPLCAQPDKLCAILYAGMGDLPELAAKYLEGLRVQHHILREEVIDALLDDIAASTDFTKFGTFQQWAHHPKSPAVTEALAEYVEDLAVKIATEMKQEEERL